MGPLNGIKVLELAGIGPAPFCCMLLSDMGAEIIRVDRVSNNGGSPQEDPRCYVAGRNRRSIAMDLKSAEGAALVLRLIRDSDVLVEGFRPGVMERLRLGPNDCHEINPRLVYGRMTGWGQDGPLACAAAHDINFISLAGVLHSIGYADSPPVPPLNLVADYGGGALYLAFGIVCALLERGVSGHGQVVDAAMIDGTTSLMTTVFSAMARGKWNDKRGHNMLDGGAPWYSVYETKDGKFVSIGAVEAQFYQELLQRLGLDGKDLPAREDPALWPELRKVFAGVFASRTRDEWCSALEGSDVCFSPVLAPSEAPEHPHMIARNAFVDRDGVVQPSPAPRFSRTAPAVMRPPPFSGEHTSEILTEAGFPESEVASLLRAGVVRQHRRCA